jgi:hypothetical protein
MKTQLRIVLLAILLVSFVTGRAQFNPKEVCRVENGKIILRIDLNWTQAQRHEVSRLFDIDSLVMAGVYAGKKEIRQDSSTWIITKINDHIAELSKVISALPLRPTAPKTIFMVDDRWLKLSMVSRESADYGVNKFTKVSVFNYRNNIVRLFLPGYTHAKNVYLSGSFNNWSTQQTRLQACDSGWIIQLKLLPGKYSYKYIVDGKWMPDPFNRNREDDIQGDFNSVFYCYNYEFRLSGHPTAHKVYLTGSFNGWREDELSMIPYRGIWVRPLYLRQGTHTYKFIVDREWITDPDNKLVRPDGSGNFNSVMGIGDSTLFSLKGFTGASKVVLSGSFNGWNTSELFMEKKETGWELYYVLGPGNYEYKFIVDGKWMTDPSNPFTTGSGDYQNSFLA